MRRFAVVAALVCLAAFAVVGIAGASSPGADVRLTNDCHPDVAPPSTGATASCGVGYVSSYTIATGIPYTDPVLDECTVARGRQNEPSVEVDPRNTQVLVGSSNDYCGVYAGRDGTTPIPTGPIWLGYYRSESSGRSFVSSLVPGYPGDSSLYRALSQARTAGAGDPVIAWDAQGRVFLGSESSDDPAGSKKTFGDVFVARYENTNGPTGATINDGKRYTGSTIVDRGSSAPNLLGQFNDKTAIQADHNSDGRCDNYVYFAYSRFQGGSQNNSIQFVRSTDHGATYSSPQKISEQVHGVQFADIAVTGSSNVYVTFRQFASKSGQPDAVVYVKSTDCGRTFSKPATVTTFTPYDAQDIAGPAPTPPQSRPDDPTAEAEGDAVGGTARDCGDFAAACKSGYTFFRRDSQVRSTGDQFAGSGDDTVYAVYDASKPGTIVSTGTTYGSIEPGLGSQSGIYFVRFNGLTGQIQAGGPKLIDPEASGHQTFPDISADGGVLHSLWWDSRFDPCYSPTRPIGNCTNRSTVASLDVYATSSPNGGASWDPAIPVTDVRSNPNYEQFGNRTVPFAGDYLWISSLGNYAYGVWTDWRDTVAGPDPREAGDSDADGADVLQCRTVDSTGTFSGDTCPHAGGIDQNIYGDNTP